MSAVKNAAFIKSNSDEIDPLFSEVEKYLTSFDFPLAYLIQKKFKIGFSRAEKILRQIEASKKPSV